MNDKNEESSVYRTAERSKEVFCKCCKHIGFAGVECRAEPIIRICPVGGRWKDYVSASVRNEKLDCKLYEPAKLPRLVRELIDFWRFL